MKDGVVALERVVVVVAVRAHREEHRAAGRMVAVVERAEAVHLLDAVVAAVVLVHHQEER